VEEFHLHHDGAKVSRRNVCKDCENARKWAHRHNEKPVLLKKSTGDPQQFKPEVKDLVTVYLNLIHWKPDNLRTVSREKYNKHFNLEIDAQEFTAIEDAAEQRLEEFGYFTPQYQTLPYDSKTLVIGDTFGTHTPECVFHLLQLIVEREGIEHVVILGHNLDDENLVSNLIASFGVPTTLVAIKDELKDLYEQRGYGYEIVQDHVLVGDIVLRNQEHITPYVKTALSQLDSRLFPGRQIVNCTRMELSVRPTPSGTQPRYFIASPGALADPHVVTTINRLIFNDGGHLSVRPTNKDSYHKHRKNETDKWLWERGFIILQNNSFVQRRIIVKNGVAYGVSNDEVIDSNGAVFGTKTTMVLSDLHLPYTKLATLVAILTSFKPDALFFNGDVFDCRSFNPHNTYEASCTDLKDELRQCRMQLEELLDNKRSHFSDNLDKDHIGFLWGNHEDFVWRFSKQYPQFASLFEDLFNDMLGKYGKLISSQHQDWYKVGHDVVVHHGSADIFGVGGNNLEKTARTFLKPAIIGHTHSPAIRFGVYRTGRFIKTMRQLDINDILPDGTVTELARGGAEIKEMISIARCASFSGFMCLAGGIKVAQDLKSMVADFRRLIENM
jgi:predicted phosphodiesterase